MTNEQLKPGDIVVLKSDWARRKLIVEDVILSYNREIVERVRIILISDHAELNDIWVSPIVLEKDDGV